MTRWEEERRKDRGKEVKEMEEKRERGEEVYEETRGIERRERRKDGEGLEIRGTICGMGK